MKNQLMAIEVFLFVAGLLVCFLYLIIIFDTYSSWQNLKECLVDTKLSNPQNSFSFIISARNEEGNIRSCLESITKLDYNRDQLDIIVVDDHSTDLTCRIAEEFEGVRILYNPLEGKKEAMKFGAEHAKNQYLWFVDGDSRLHKDAARLANASLTEHTFAFAACPIVYPPGKGLLNAFQVMDGVVNMAVTAAGISSKKYYLANGANMLVHKETFIQVDGFDGNGHLASGDDVFLIQKIALLDPGSIHFLKSRSMAAQTEGESSWSSFWKQRKRWATKSGAYKHKGLYYFQISIFVVHAIIIAFLALGIFMPVSFFIGLLVLIIKALMDYLFVYKMTSFFGVSKINKWFIPAFLMYFPYIFYTAFHAVFPSRYEWKGRQRR